MDWSGFGAPGAPARSRLLPGMTGLLLDTFALIGEIAVGRSRMGRRYLTIIGVAGSYAALQVLPLVVAGLFAYCLSSVQLGLLGGLISAVLVSQMPWSDGTIWYTAFTWFFLARSVWLLIEGDYLRRAGEPIPSTYSGRPSPLWTLIPFGPPLQEGQIKRYGEPLLLLAVAYLLHTTDLLLALYLGTSGVALFVKGQLEHRILSHQAADLDDQVFDSAGLSARFGGSATTNEPQGMAQPVSVAPGNRPVVDRPTWAATTADYGTLLNAPLPEIVPILDDWYLPEEPAPVVQNWIEPSASSPAFMKAVRPFATIEAPRTKVRCPHCGQVGKVPLRDGPQRILCHGCDRRFTIPNPTSQPS